MQSCHAHSRRKGRSSAVSMAMLKLPMGALMLPCWSHNSRRSLRPSAGDNLPGAEEGPTTQRMPPSIPGHLTARSGAGRAKACGCAGRCSSWTASASTRSAARSSATRLSATTHPAHQPTNPPGPPAHPARPARRAAACCACRTASSLVARGASGLAPANWPPCAPLLLVNWPPCPPRTLLASADL